MRSAAKISAFPKSINGLRLDRIAAGAPALDFDIGRKLKHAATSGRPAMVPALRATTTTCAFVSSWMARTNFVIAGAAVLGQARPTASSIYGEEAIRQRSDIGKPNQLEIHHGRPAACFRRSWMIVTSSFMLRRQL